MVLEDLWEAKEDAELAADINVVYIPCLLFLTMLLLSLVVAVKVADIEEEPTRSMVREATDVKQSNYIYLNYIYKKI